MPQTARDHFIETYRLYMVASAQQARDRHRDHLRTLDEYFTIRRDTIGSKPCYALVEAVVDLPPEALSHPTIAQLETHATDMIIFSNVSVFHYTIASLLISWRIFNPFRTFAHIMLNKHEGMSITTSLPF